MTPELKYWLLILLAAVYLVPAIPKLLSLILGAVCFSAALLVLFGVMT